MKLKEILTLSPRPHSTIPQPSVRLAQRSTPSSPAFLPQSTMTWWPTLGTTVSRQVWSISMSAVPMATSATQGSMILVILHFLLWKAGSMSCGLILTVMPGLTHSTSSSSPSSPSFCFLSSSQSFSILFIFFWQMGASSLASRSRLSTLQRAERLLSALNPLMLNSSLSGMTINFRSSSRRANSSLSSFSLRMAQSRSRSILEAIDFSSCSFSRSRSSSIFSFLAASMKSLVLWTVQTTLQLGGVPMTWTFLTAVRQWPNSARFFHWVWLNLRNFLSSMSSLQSSSRQRGSPGYLVLMSWMKRHSNSREAFSMCSRGLLAKSRTRIWWLSEFRWHLKPFSSLHCFRHSSQKCFSRPPAITLLYKNEPPARPAHIMNNEIGEQQALAALRGDLALPPDELAKLLADRKRLTERVELYNARAVACIADERWEQGLVYLEAAEQLLQSAAVRGQLTDPCLVQCILHNEANCYQNLWQLDQCSNYIEALIFNLNSRKSLPPSPTSNALKHSKLALAQYYLQFCAINSQLANHSGALISARKALNIIRAELAQWRPHFQESKRKNDEEKLRLLHLVCRFNDSINLNLAETLAEAAVYYLKSWRVTINSAKPIARELRELIQNFNIKNVMALGALNLPECIARYESGVSMSLVDICERIFVLATCYFTIATELRLISMKKSRDSNLSKADQPEYKESEIYHLLAILLLALTLPAQSPFLAHLILSFQNHYVCNLAEQEVPFRKAFAEIIFLKEERNLREPSIEISEHEEALGSHLSKGSGTMIRKTKGSKESEREQKYSLIDPKSKKSKLKHTKAKESKSKKEIPSSKSKNPRPSLSKSPLPKSNSKESIIIKSQRSKDSLHQRSPIPSIKLINPSKTKNSHQNIKSNEKEKTVKPKRKTKLEENENEYFLIRKREQKRQKKTSVSSKKSSGQARSTGRLPIDSTLQTKDNQLLKEKKKGKKSILQHYL